MKKIIKMLWITVCIGMSTVAMANDQFGTIVGGVAGGILGNNIVHGSGKTAATIGGAVIGSMVGNSIGENERYRPREYQTCQYRDRYRDREESSYTPMHRTFIGQDGRLCRYSMLTDEFGDRMYATFCCYRMSPDGHCRRWIRV